jgi:hypothetical protein
MQFLCALGLACRAGHILLTLSDLFVDHLAVFLRAPDAVTAILAFRHPIAVAFFERVNKRRDTTRSSV